MKSKKYLDEFSQFCKLNPQLRFWQALRAWWKEHHDSKANFIIISEDYNETLDYEKVKDTFYIE